MEGIIDSNGNSPLFVNAITGGQPWPLGLFLWLSLRDSVLMRVTIAALSGLGQSIGTASIMNTFPVSPQKISICCSHITSVDQN
jgi:hypothetical protein